MVQSVSCEGDEEEEEEREQMDTTTFYEDRNTMLLLQKLTRFILILKQRGASRQLTIFLILQDNRRAY